MRAPIDRLLGWLVRLLPARPARRPMSRPHRLERLEDRLALSTAAPTACRCPHCCGAAYTLAGGNNLSTNEYRWPQPGGFGSMVTITYSYSNLLDGRLGGGMSPAAIRGVIQEAFSRWAAVAPLHFVEMADSGPAPSAADYDPAGKAMIRLGHRPIDGPHNVLAYGYYPGLAGLSGDIQLDSAEPWTSNPHTGTDLLEVAVHEIGHTLGLGHEPLPSSGGNQAIMNPIYGSHFAGPGTSYLFADDINGIRALYGVGRGGVTPLVTTSPFAIVGTVLYVFGTAGNDMVTVRSDGVNLTAQVNGQTGIVAIGRVSNVVVNTGGGVDTLVLWGDSRHENLVATVSGVTLSGANYRVTGYNHEHLHFAANAADGVALYGGGGADTFTGTATGAALSGAGYSMTVYNAGSVSVNGGGGTDTATLTGTAGADTFIASATDAALGGQGLSLSVALFERVYAVGNGGADIAYLYGGAWDEAFVATPTGAYITGFGIILAASNFSTVRASGGGGVNRAYLFDSAGDDAYVRYHDHSTLAGPGFANTAYGFQVVTATASSGTDAVMLQDSPGDDTFIASGDYGTLNSVGGTVTATGFDRVQLVAVYGGRNRRQLFGQSFDVTTIGVWE